MHGRHEGIKRLDPDQKHVRTDKLQEKHENKITLTEDSVVIENLIKFCYTGGYGGLNLIAPTKSRAPRLRLHAGVYLAAEKYQISALKHVAVRRFKVVMGDWASDWQKEQDKEVQLIKLQEFLEVIQLVYENTLDSSDALRKDILALDWKTEMMSTYEQAWTDFLAQTPSFAAELTIMNNRMLTDMDDWTSWIKLYECPHCKFEFKTDGAHDRKEAIRGYCWSCGRHVKDWEEHLTEDDDKPNRSDY